VTGMRLFRRKNGGTALAERFAPDYPGTTADLWDEIERTAAANREHREVENDRRLLWLRHVAGIRALEAGAGGDFAAPDRDRLPTGDPLPEVARADVTPGVLRAGILRDGCVLVRGLVDREAAERFAGRIDRGFAECERFLGGEEPAEGYYEEFRPHMLSKGVLGREWIQQSGGLLAADSPTLAFEMLELFR
jgi:hypothetical protein